MIVTGGAGFIGSHIVDGLLKRGLRVVVIDDFSTGSQANLAQQAVLYQIDIRDRARVLEVFDQERPAAVFHLAAQASVVVSTREPGFDVQTNVLGTLHLLEAAARVGCRHFLFSSTGGAIYAPSAPLPCTEDSPVGPLSVYGLSKAAAESYIRYFERVHGMLATILRLSNVYGPRQNSQGEAGVVAIFCDRALTGGQILLDGDGEQTRDFVYVEDVAGAFLTACIEGITGTCNVSTGKETTVNRLYYAISEAVHTTPAVEHGPARPNDMRRSVLSSDRLQRAGSWKPQVAFDEGVARTVEWFRQHPGKL